MEYVNEAMKEDQSAVRVDREEVKKIIGILAAREHQYPQ
jgi:hypothetical protein